MAELSFDRNAKLITVLRPALEITIQELYNKIKEYEDDLINMDLPQICTASGKEPLGGSVFVGITLTLLDGWRITFQDSPDSPVQEVADVTGGNIVAQLEPFGADNPTFQNPIAPAGNLVITKTSSSSATLLEQAALQAGVFNGRVHLNSTTGVSGTTYPTGTEQQPSDNWADAIAIAEERGIREIHIERSETIPAGIDLENYTIVGANANRTILTVSAGASTNTTEFIGVSLQGQLDGNNIIRQCILLDGLVMSSGIAHESMLNPGTITLFDSSSPQLGVVHFLQCYSGVPGLGTPIIDMGGSGFALAMRDYDGGIQINNKTGPESVSLDFNSGQAIIDSTVTNGTIVVRGISVVTDNSTGSAVVNVNGNVVSQNQSIIACCNETRNNTEAILVLLDLVRKYDSNRTRIDPIAQTLTVYDDDGVTPLTIFELKDEDGNLSITEVYERDPLTDRGSPPDGSPLV